MWYFLWRLWKELKSTRNKLHFIWIKICATTKQLTRSYPSSNWCILMSPEKFAAAMIGSSFLASWNLEIVSLIHLSMTLMGAKIWHLGNADDFLHSPTKVSFPPWCFSSWYMILCAWLMVWPVMGELDVASSYIRAAIQFIACLQKYLHC